MDLALLYLTTDRPLSMTVAVLMILVISMGAHEAAHAWVADRCGDSTARDMGRVTLNPIPHIDPVMSIILPAILLYSGGFIFGGAKPVPVIFNNLRNPLRDMALVAIAGPLTNLAIAPLLALACHWSSNVLLVETFRTGYLFNVLLAVFNLLPLPPLDGSRVMAWLLPPSVRAPYVSLERYGLLIVIFFVFFVPGMQSVLMQAMSGLDSLITTLLGIPPLLRFA